MSVIEDKLKNLTPDLQHEVMDFIDFLLTKNRKKPTGKRPHGLAKGDIKISDDFSTPLNEKTMQEWGIL